MNTKLFGSGIVFESDTLYTADRKEYHIYPNNTAETINPWYTTGNTDGKPLIATFILRGLKNITIDLDGAKLIFHGRIMPFAIFDCENITFRNFSVDYDRTFFTQGTVVEVGKGSITIDIPEIFRFRVEDDYLVAESDTWEYRMNRGDLLFSVFNPNTGRLSPTCGCLLGLIGSEIFPGRNPPLPIHHLHAQSLGGRMVRITGFPDSFVPNVGEILAFTHEDRRKPGFLVERSTDTIFENIRLIHVSSMGCIANLCHNLTFRHFNTYLDGECEGRIISINADVLHGFHCDGKILVEDCRFESMLDDSFNFHGNYTICVEQKDEHTLFLRNPGAGLKDMQFYLPGDKVTIRKGSTLEVRAVYTVASSKILENNTLALTAVESVYDFHEGDIVESMHMPEIEIRRCSIARARGVWRLSSSSRVLMEDCIIDNSAILFTDDTCYWYENTGARDVEIRNCTFINCDCGISVIPAFTSTEVEPYYHKNIRVLNNRFVDCGQTALNLNYADNILFAGNTDGSGNLIGLEAVHAEHSGHITVG